MAKETYMYEDGKRDAAMRAARCQRRPLHICMTKETYPSTCINKDFNKYVKRNLHVRFERDL